MNKILTTIKNICENIINLDIEEINRKEENSNNVKNLNQSLIQITNILRPNTINTAKSQKETFVYLSDKGLIKLTKMINEINHLSIRKNSFNFLVNLLYNNEVLITIFCEKFGFSPIGNVICINWLPKIFETKIRLSLDLINEIKTSSNNFKQKTKYWKFPNNDKYNDTNIPDPHKYFLGIVYKGNDTLKNNLLSLNQPENICISSFNKISITSYKKNVNINGINIQDSLIKILESS